ncbi:helix-turn-helix domain-containing protein [Methylophaga sp. UBA2689]|uniref:helix-turn-helix domain-containing protein n=1 Tax=Methylophaga sp. UBA2689 TaxID=1946878 RepID=UPI0039C9E3BF|tara:strand:- start:2075 stop:2263 length:189 start_codon:yes stop_codon:yes gene_type:complete
MNTKQQIQKLLDAGYTQNFIAAQTGVSQPTISRILRDLHHDMKASTASSIAKLYQELIDLAA